MTESLVLGFIFIFHTKKTGKMPKLQSVTALMAAWAYVTFASTDRERQDPLPVPNWVQMYSMGVHWKTRKKKYIVLNSMTTLSVV